MSARSARARSLAAWLDAFEPLDATEAGHRAQMRAACELETDAFARDHWVPGHFTASAFVLSPAEDAVLLIHHSKLGRWLQPGGHFEPDDADVLAAVLREVAEETGLTGVQQVGAGLFDVDVHRIPARRADPEHLHLDARVLLRAPTLDFRAGSDALAARWVPLRQVSALESDASVMRAVGRLLASGRA